MSASPLEQFDRTPVTFVILIAYVTLAFLTDPVSPSGEALIDHGAALGVLVQDGEPWRLLTHAFLHGGLLHLAFNGYFLFVFGPQIEQRLGSLRFTALYVVTAIGGGVAAGLWNEPIVLLVGGSGALFGMFGAAIALFMREGQTHLDFLNYQGPRALMSLVAFNLVLGWLIPMISNSAHVGGLVTGFAMTFCFLERGRARPDGWSRVIQAGWVALFAGIVLYVAVPVLRWDYLYRMSLEADDAAARNEYRSALEACGVSIFVQPRGHDFASIDRSLERAFAQVLGERGERLVASWRH